jgi:flagellar assembly factor FliW
MTINTSRFGEIEITPESILYMPDGMLGFPECRRYVLLENDPGVRFKWMQAVDEPTLAFIVINPMDFFVDYDIDLSDEDADTLGIEDPSDAALMTTVTVDRKLERCTTNLVGPIVINSKTLRAKQVVLSDSRYGTKHVVGMKAGSDRLIETMVAA